jgi:hypothetical protein
MEAALLQTIQHEEDATTKWHCKLMFKYSNEDPEIDILDYVNLSNE